MFPGVNPRQLKAAMQKMGVNQTDIDATEVIIRCSDKELVITNPQVAKVSMMGQISYQVTGEAIERPLAGDGKPEISDDDVAAVVAQTGVSDGDARSAIEEANGDLAEAIMKLKGE